MTDNTETQASSGPKKSPLRRKRQLKHVAIVIVAVLLAVWLAFWLYHRMTHVSEKDAQVASHVITVSSRLDGRVTDFDLIQGDHVQTQQLIAQLYSKPNQLKLGQIKARISNIQTRMQLATTQVGGGVDQTESMLQADKAAMQATRARMHKARDNYRRAEKLYKAHGGTEKQRDIYHFDYQSAQADYQRAQTQVKTDKVAIANAKTGLLPGGQVTNPDVLKSQLKVAQAQLAHQQNMIDDLTVRSPIDGVIDQTFIEQDEYVSAGQPIVMMHDPTDVWIEAKVKETKIHDLGVGQSVAINVDARPDTHYSGHVKVIGNAATNQFALLPNPNPSGNFTKITQRIPVRIAIDHGPKPKLAPGMMVEVDINTSDSGSDPKDQRQHPAQAHKQPAATSDAGSDTDDPSSMGTSATEHADDQAQRQQTSAVSERVARSGLQLAPAGQLD